MNQPVPYKIGVDTPGGEAVLRNGYVTMTQLVGWRLTGYNHQTKLETRRILLKAINSRGQEATGLLELDEDDFAIFCTGFLAGWRRDKAAEIWGRLSQVPVNDEGYIQEGFDNWPIGTHLGQIEYWLEDVYKVPVWMLKAEMEK